VTELGWGSLDTPVGQVSVACTDAGVARVSYGPPAGPGPVGGTLASVLLEAALEELDLYFGRGLKRFAVPVDLGSAHRARRTVLEVLHRTVRFGQTITYGTLATRAGLDSAAAPGSAMPPARVVGQIMASNPVPLIVPCHRVVAGNGLGGYSGGTGTDVKQWLLVFEGALPATLDWDPAGPRPRLAAASQAQLAGAQPPGAQLAGARPAGPESA
jgi:methylated-DNA-[protein]-cysteine S-methyltransferase